MRQYNQGKGNNFRPPNQGRGGINVESTGQGRGRGNFFQERTNYSCFHYAKFECKVVDCKFRPINQNSYNTQANVNKNQHNIGENSNLQSLFLVSNSFAMDKHT